MEMNHIRRGAGKPLLLIHGIGGSWRSWQTILDDLAQTREVIAVDLPGHGATPPLDGEVSIRTLADAVTEFVNDNNLNGVDAVGSSMGARLVLELARRGGVLGGVVSLDPGGFWRGWERHAFYASIYASIRLVRVLQPVMPQITASAFGRTLLFAQFSARPWKLSPEVTLDEMHSYAASPSFDELLYNLAYGEEQKGAPQGSIEHPLVIGWGRRDRVCFRRQVKRALALFPDARLHWFDRCGHFPQWDAPREATRLILAATSGFSISDAGAAQSDTRPLVRPEHLTRFDQSF
ncbi:MAG: alpha/beta fold hydrolase [Pyrinomonadaceae bacterium]|nr:alpha/beta fold hydrolase [Pyrinomonadaceae bacterium]